MPDERRVSAIIGALLRVASQLDKNFPSGCSGRFQGATQRFRELGVVRRTPSRYTFDLRLPCFRPIRTADHLQGTISTWRAHHGELRMSGRALTIVLLILASVDILEAADKSPKQILGGKPAVSNMQSGRYYNGQGAFAGRSSTSGQTTRLYDAQGRAAGRVEASKSTARAYSGTGAYAGRTATSGNDTRFYDANGSFNGRSTVNGNSTRFYDSRGAFAGRAETSGRATRFYDAQGRFSGSKR